MSRNHTKNHVKMEMEWTPTEYETIQKAEEMALKGGYHLFEILNVLREGIRPERSRTLDRYSEAAEEVEENVSGDCANN